MIRARGDAVERQFFHLLGPRVDVPVDAVPEAHELEGVVLVLGPREKFGNAVLAPDLACVEIKFCGVFC